MVDNLIDPFDCVLVQLHCRFLSLLVICSVSIHQICCTLNSCICQLTYLLTVVAVPFPSIELVVELVNEFGVDEVSECIAHVAWVKAVNGKVEVVNSLPVFFSDFLHQHLLRIFVGNVSDHDSGSTIWLYLNKQIKTCVGMMRY